LSYLLVGGVPAVSMNGYCHVTRDGAMGKGMHVTRDGYVCNA
jgi:hypothetical protein